MKIFDCFSFYNEFDMLDLHLAELYDHVDYFVLSEANTTHQSNPKPFYFEENKQRYAKYLDKIIHVKVEDMPNSPDTWVNERFQRDAIVRGLTEAGPDDICIVGDCDEILRPEVVDQLRNSTQTVMGFRVPFFNFKFNYMLVNNREMYCVWTVACKRSALESASAMRAQRFSLATLPFHYEDENVKMYENAGWHFTNVGDDDFIKNKIMNYAHKELNTPEVLAKINVQEVISRGVGINPNNPQTFVQVAVDEYLPQTIIQNVEQYQDKILSGTANSASQYLPK